MPKCPYCGEYPYATYCQSYQEHVRRCEKSANRAVKLATEDKKIPSKTTPGTVVYNITNNVVVMNNISVYTDYPVIPLTTNILNLVEKTDLKKIKSVEDVNQIVNYAYDADNGFIEKCMHGTDIRAKSQALSFLADVARRIRETMIKQRQNEGISCVEIEEVVEGVKEYEKELLDEKKLLGC